MLGKKARKAILTAILFTTVFGIIVSDEHLKTWEGESGDVTDVFYLPQSQWIRPLFLGHEAFVADLIWIRTIGYFADQLLGRRKFTYLEDLVNLALDLDPRFENVYIWAGAVFMYRGGVITKEMVLASTRIMEKGWRTIQNDPVGWRHIPNYWMIPQMIGFNYAIELHDRKSGAPYIAATAKIPGSPDIYKTWAATLYKKAGEFEEGTHLLEDMLAVETLESQLKNLEENRAKEQIRERLAIYYSRLYGEEGARERIEMLENKILRLVSQWQQEMPYVTFNLFLLLRKGEETIEEKELSEVWSNLFPLLTATER